MHTTDMQILSWIPRKVRKDRIRNEKFKSDAIFKPITICHPESLSWYGHVMTRDDKNSAKEITTMQVAGKGPEGRRRRRWVDRVRSDMKKLLLDLKLG